MLVSIDVFPFPPVNLGFLKFRWSLFHWNFFTFISTLVNPISRAIVPAILCRCRVFSHNRSQQIMSSNKISTCTKLGKRASYHSKYDVCLASLRSNTFPLSFLLQIFPAVSFFLIRNEWKQNMRCSFSSVHNSIIMKLINPFGLLCLLILFK